MDIIDVLWNTIEHSSTEEAVKRYEDSMLTSTTNIVDESLWSILVDNINDEFSNRSSNYGDRACRYIKLCMKNILDIPEAYIPVKVEVLENTSYDDCTNDTDTITNTVQDNENIPTHNSDVTTRQTRRRRRM